VPEVSDRAVDEIWSQHVADRLRIEHAAEPGWRQRAIAESEEIDLGDRKPNRVANATARS
jgi:hypothetical protein